MLELKKHQDKARFYTRKRRCNSGKTDVDSFAVLEPVVDGFRNYQKEDYGISPEEMLLDKAQIWV